ncbi:hypothetical protein N0V84_005592 [Fusarium piperis]|uniref:Ketoreductase domain-containing protein n=1 Tax=Fusarium piperis TaxID=1435070 RepID=A0A9W8WDG8_9HYPO|nr:hypothetical protein N0V84_005592 [Fusarium piperis]
MSNNQETVGYRVFDMTKTSHKASYPAISPSKPSLSQAGKTVLITGGSGGIGFAIARAFGKAGAEKVIIVGRADAKVGSAAEQLNEQNQGSGTVFEGRACQLDDSESIDMLWDKFETDGIKIDVIVLNAAMTGQFGPIESLGWKKVWKEFEVNVRSYHQFCDRLHQNAQSQGGKRYIVNVSTSAIHDFPAASYAPSYSLTKNSAALLLQQIAREWKVSDIQIVSFHPGALLTPGATSLGLDETSLPWDDISLPASVAVWAASEEAAFLHGRFIWAPWDVEELASGEIRERLESDEKFLRIGVHGLEAPKDIV